jgi:hypothetical protein
MSSSSKDRAPEGYSVTLLHVAVFSSVALVNTLIYRMVYPYAPFIAPALSLSLSDYAW